MRVSWSVRAPSLTENLIEADRAQVLFVGGEELRAQRFPAVAEYSSPLALDPTRIAHPVLARIGGVFARWRGLEVLHAGALLEDGVALGLLGTNLTGKSTLLGAHAVREGLVLADDMLVIDRGRALVGPRCIDLRESAAAHLCGADIPLARAGLRHRLELLPTQSHASLAGLVYLEWGDRVEIERVPARDRGARIAGFRHWGAQLGTDSQGLLDLLSLPAWILRRPRTWSALDESLELLLTLAREHNGLGPRAPAAPRGS